MNATSEAAPQLAAPGTSLHWAEYAIEAFSLGAFMVSACVFGVLLQHPASALHRALPDSDVQRAVMGLAMGLTAVAIIYSPWGRRSGAHLNPSTTLTFLRLGRVRPRDALCYVAAQFIGGAVGVGLAATVLGPALAHPNIAFVATVPGPAGIAAAFGAEVAISFVLMTAVLAISSRPRWERWTGAAAGALVALYIFFEAPISGMSMNPARTLASALFSHSFRGLWIYFTAPVTGMLLAAQTCRRLRGCAKLRHDGKMPCIFCGAPARPQV